MQSVEECVVLVLGDGISKREEERKEEEQNKGHVDCLYSSEVFNI